MLADCLQLRYGDCMAKGANMIRKNRQTGTMIEVYSEGRGVWFTICVDHGTAVQHSSKVIATDWAASPATWCESCQGVANVTR